MLLHNLFNCVAFLFADSLGRGLRAAAENEEPGNISDGLILISGGTFSMGSPSSERQRQEDEIQHDVTVSSFYIDPYEVTQSDYAAIIGENPSHFTGENLLVENVTWYDAVEYCNRLSESRGLTPAYTIDGNTICLLGSIPNPLDSFLTIYNTVQGNFNEALRKIPKKFFLVYLQRSLGNIRYYLIS